MVDGKKNNLFWRLMVTEFLGHLTVDNKRHWDPLDKGWKVPSTALSHNLTLWDIKELPGMWQTSDSDHANLPSGGPSSLFLIALDCELSLFFFRFSKGSARAREHWAAKPRDARNEGGSPRRKKSRLLSCPSRRLQSRAWSFACLGRFTRRTKKKERLLVVYDRLIAGNYHP